MIKTSPTSHSLVELLGLSILFAETDEKILSHVSHVLTPFCREFHAAKNGKAALDLFRMKTPDLVMTDISLPIISGLELTRKIKQMSPSVPVIMISAQNDTEHLMQAIDLNVDGYLTKPFSIEKLFFVLQRQVANLNSRRISEHEPRLLAGVNMAIQYLLSADANQDAVDFALQEMAKAAQADKISLYRYDSLMGEREVFLVSGFAQGDMIRRFLDGADIGSPEIPYIERWYGILSQGKTLTGPRSSFPAKERHIIDSMHAHSLLMTPIFAEGRLWGFACLCDMQHERHWSDAETSMVMTAARGLGSFMGRLRLEQERHEARKALQLSNIQWRETFDTIPDITPDSMPPIENMSFPATCLAEPRSNSCRSLAGSGNYFATDERMAVRVGDSGFLRILAGASGFCRRRSGNQGALGAEVSGRLTGIDPSGELIIETEAGEVSVQVGDVHLRLRP